MKYKVVELDAGEMAVVTMLAAMRHSCNRKHNVSNSRIGPQSDHITDLDGLIAEFAFCKWKNIYPDLTINPRSGGSDCVINKKRVDIKTTRYKQGRLLATISKKPTDVDVYILSIIEDNKVTFVGWAMSDELLQQSNIVDLGHGKSYALAQSQLRQFNFSQGD
jgi:hypothetical protein